MDSELSDITAVKGINQDLTTTSNVTFNNMAVNGDITLPAAKYIYFDSTDTKIGASTDDDESLIITADDDIRLLADDDVHIYVGTNNYASFLGGEQRLDVPNINLGDETLEDYDHGTWTPTYPNGGAFNSNGANRRYVRVGRVVHIWGNFQVSSVGSGDFAFAGLPYAPTIASTIGSAMLGGVSGGPTLPGARGGQNFFTDGSEVRIYSNRSALEWTNMNWSAFAVNDYIYFQGTYYTEA